MNIRKKTSALLCMLFTAVSLFASLNANIKSHPTSLELSWAPESGAVYYDIYNGQDFVVRLDNNARSYTITGLDSDRSYQIALAVRDSANNTLSSVWLDGRTSSWDGVYLWTNKTDDDNKGRIREIRMRIAHVKDDVYGQYNEVYLYYNGAELKIFPLFPFDSEDAKVWHKYKEDSVGGNSYRSNAALFNKSSMTPSKWRISKIVIDRDSTYAYIQTSALSFIFDTVSSYSLYESDGKKYMEFKTESEQSIVNNALFKNPNPGEGDSFILERIE